MDTFVTTEPFRAIMLVRKKTTWYSVSDGNWSDPNTWMSNRLDKILITSPQTGDDVVISHNVTFDILNGATLNINNATISGKLAWSGNSQTLIVNGELKCTGTIDHSTAGSTPTLYIRGYYTVISTYTPKTTGGGSSIIYESLYGLGQAIAPVTYQNLTLQSSTTTQSGGFVFVAGSTKTLSADLTVNGNFQIGGILDTKGFNMTVLGTSTSAGTISTIISSQNILFVGQLNSTGGGDLTISGTASVECRGGINCTNGALTALNSNFNFTTNNQNLAMVNRNCTVNNATITGAITVTTINSNANPFIVINTLTGTVSGSTFNNNGIVQFNSNTTQMSTGVLNYMNASGASVYYGYNGSMTLPYTTYEGIGIVGTGTKTLAGNTTLNSNLSLQGTGVVNAVALDCGSNNLSVGGTTTTSNQAILKKTGAGTLLFVGQFSTPGGGNFDFSGGNPSIEFRGGINMANFGATTLFGSGAISFTTNSQTVQQVGAGTMAGAVTIGSGVTLTASNNTGFTVSGILNGIDATSIFINGLNSTLNYQNATAPMVTGKMYCNQAVNTFQYNDTNQDITVPTDPTNPGYYNLTLNGSGAKRLLGNVSVKNTYTLGGTATLNSNGFALTNP